MSFITDVVPFQLIGNRHVITDKQLREDPLLARFLDRFAHCFERDELRCAWVYAPPENT